MFSSFCAHVKLLRNIMGKQDDFNESYFFSFWVVYDLVTCLRLVVDVIEMVKTRHGSSDMFKTVPYLSLV